MSTLALFIDTQPMALSNATAQLVPFLNMDKDLFTPFTYRSQVRFGSKNCLKRCHFLDSLC